MNVDLVVSVLVVCTLAARAVDDDFGKRHGAQSTRERSARWDSKCVARTESDGIVVVLLGRGTGFGVSRRARYTGMIALLLLCRDGDVKGASCVRVVGAIANSRLGKSANGRAQRNTSG